MVEHHALAEAADYVRGVLNLRGVMVPIIDLRCRSVRGSRNDAAAYRLIVQIDERLVGLLVDRVQDIVAFEAGKFKLSEGGAILAGGLPGRTCHVRRQFDCAHRPAEPAGPADSLNGISC